MKKLILIVPIGLTILGCVPIGWQKQGASQDDFARDRYTCLQQSQQSASSAYVNGNGGIANSGSITNGGLFGACMNASGWYLASAKAAIPSNYVYDQKSVERSLELCSRNNASSDEIAACMKDLERGANNR